MKQKLSSQVHGQIRSWLAAYGVWQKQRRPGVGDLKVDIGGARQCRSVLRSASFNSVLPCLESANLRKADRHHQEDHQGG